VIDQITRLESAIRKHRDYRGDDRCWLDDEELYRVLPEGFTAPPRDTAVELAKCQQYIACRHNPRTVYVSPETEITRLEWSLRQRDRLLTLIALAGWFWIVSEAVKWLRS
jgi:hypothetical protein